MILIIDKNSLAISSHYEGEANQSRYGGPWGDPAQFAHMEMPEGLDRDCLSLSLVDDEIVIAADEAAEDAKAAAQLEAAWDALREERNARLAACDFTQLSDAPMTSEKKTEWATHRQTLRDLPENTEDPASPSWPAEPAE